jgi:hypothetical protein
MTSPLDPTPVVLRLAEEALSTSAVLREASDIQWQPSPAPRPREDTTERSKGGHSDPTVNTVTDPRRLQLRAAVLEAEHLLESATRALAASRRRLEAAVDAWNGADL